jgi:hypothetical protein
LRIQNLLSFLILKDPYQSVKQLNSLHQNSHLRPNNFAPMKMRATIEDIKDSPKSGADPSEPLKQRKVGNITTPHHPRSLRTSYPSQALRFLEKVNGLNGTFNPSPSLPEQARTKMSIIVVGAGLGGLALAIALARRGHSVRVLEQASKLGEVRSVILLTICMLTQSLGRRRNSNSTKLRAPTTRLGCF